MSTSVITRSGCSARTAASPSLPSAASSSRCPCVTQERDQDFPVGREVVNDQDGRHVALAPSGQLGRDGRQKLLVAHRLGDVAIAAGGSNALFVALHRERGEGDHRDRARRVVSLEQRRRCEAVHAGQAGCPSG